MSYAHAQYALSLADFGSPRHLPACGGWVLERPVPGQPGLRDAMGPYPLFACRDWSGLPIDLAELRDDGVVSVVLVADPLSAPPTNALPRWFDGVCRPWKDHYLVDLTGSPDGLGSVHHRRNARRFRRHAEIDVCAAPEAHLDTWCALYAELVDRHGVTGPARFSRDAFAAQLALPGALLLRARDTDGAPLGMQLWFTEGDRAWHHLSGYAAAGYRWGGASYGLMQAALAHLAGRGVTVADLGSGAGTAHDPGDGLSRFKAGWSTRTVPAWLCGAVLDPARYAALDTESSDHFPCYRDPARSPVPEAVHAPVD